MGRSPISMAMFNSFLCVYQAGHLKGCNWRSSNEMEVWRFSSLGNSYHGWNFQPRGLHDTRRSLVLSLGSKDLIQWKATALLWIGQRNPINQPDGFSTRRKSWDVYHGFQLVFRISQPSTVCPHKTTLANLIKPRWLICCLGSTATRKTPLTNAPRPPKMVFYRLTP